MEGKTSNNNTNKQNSRLDEMQRQLQELFELSKKQQEENEKLRILNTELMEKISKPTNVGTVAPAEENRITLESAFGEVFDANRMVEIIHLADRADGITTTLFLSDGRSLAFRKYGDSARIRYFELQQLLSAYYELFRDNRIFTLGAKDQDIAEAERLPSFDEKCLTKDEVRGLLELPASKLADVYTRVCDTHKQLILSTWQRGYFANEHPGYRDLDKINALNKVSDFALRTVYDNITDKK